MVWVNIQAEKGTHLELMLIRDLNEKMVLTDEDKAACGFVPNEAGAIWKDKDYTVDIDLSKTELAFIKSRVDSLSKSGHLPYNALSLYEKMQSLPLHTGGTEDETT